MSLRCFTVFFRSFYRFFLLNFREDVVKLLGLVISFMLEGVLSYEAVRVYLR